MIATPTMPESKLIDIFLMPGDYFVGDEQFRVRTLLRQHGIRLVSESLFGEGHRHLIFTIRSGEVLSRQVPPEPATAHARENA